MDMDMHVHMDMDMDMQCIMYGTLRSRSFGPLVRACGDLVWEGVTCGRVMVVQTLGREPAGSGAYAKRSSSVVVKGRLATASPSERSEL